MGLNQGIAPHLDESSTPPDHIPLSSSMENHCESGSRDHAAVRGLSQTSESFSTHSSTGTTATASRSLLYITQLRIYQLNPHHLPVVNQDIQVVEAVDRDEDNDPEVDTPAALEAEQQQSDHDVAPLRENNEYELMQLGLREPIQLGSSEPMQLDSPEPEIYNFDNSDEYVNVFPHSK